MYCRIFSEERLKRYYVEPTYTIDDAVACYLWNIALSEAFYPIIAIYEVHLRNNIYNSINNHITQNWLDESTSWLQQKEKNKIIKAKKYLNQHGKLSCQGQIISNLTLNFWGSLFENAYKPVVWNKPKVFDDTFPNFDKKVSDKISIIMPYHTKIQTIRNRISHHEPIFNYPGGLDNAFNDFIIILNWLSKDSQSLLARVNRFNEIYSLNMDAYR